MDCIDYLDKIAYYHYNVSMIDFMKEMYDLTITNENDFDKPGMGYYKKNYETFKLKFLDFWGNLDKSNKKKLSTIAINYKY